MKRSREGQTPSPEKLVTGSEEANIPRKTPKRPKSSQACSSCRRSKTRCELLDTTTSSSALKCHRCKVLNLQCSFETSGVPMPSVSNNSPSTPYTAPPSYRQSPEGPGSPFGNRSDSGTTMPVSGWVARRIAEFCDEKSMPMLALQEFARHRPADYGDHIVDTTFDLSMSDILTEGQKQFLLDIYYSRYSSWLNLQPSQEVDSPLLNLVRCTISSRHLDVATRAVASPRLQKLSNDVISAQLFSPQPSTEVVRAIIILSLWSPVCCTPSVEARDGRLLSGAAVSIAMNLRLGHESANACSLRDLRRREFGLSEENEQNLADAMDKARLWISLSNAESMLCIGTGRIPLSSRSDADNALVDKTTFTTVESSRDMRLGLLGELWDLTEKGIGIRFQSYAEMDPWYRSVSDVLGKMLQWHRLISPLHLVSSHETFHFHSLQIFYHFCRLLVLHLALREGRLVLEERLSDTAKPWYLLVSHNGDNIITRWGQEALNEAEAVLIHTLMTELRLLGTAPDNVFAMISFAAAFLIVAKFSVCKNHRQELPGASDSLLGKTIECLKEAAYTPDHAPAKCAQLIAAWVETWQQQRAATLTFNTEEEHRPAGVIDHAISAERTSSQPTSHDMPEFGGHGEDRHSSQTDLFPNLASGHDFNRFMSSDIFLDTDFWASFMHNLSSSDATW